MLTLSGERYLRFGPSNDLGAINLNAGGTLDNRVHLAIDSGYTQANDGLFLNNHLLENNGTFDNRGTVTNTGEIINTGTFKNAGDVVNNGSIINDGLIVNESSFSISGELIGNGTYRQLAGHTEVNGLMDQALIEINGGSLSGTGTITGDVIVGHGGSFAPGNSPGTLYFEQDLIFNEGSEITFEIAGTDAGEFDQIVVDGLFEFDGTIIFDFYGDLNTDILSEFTIFDFIVLSFYDSVDFTLWDFADHSISLNLDGSFAVSQVPVPAAAWLFGSALLGLVGLKRRK